ncbi:hypothetical protein Taro_025555 [Colocasia esculenta]|uniref:Uncharacterized protein n=1 Tax=Colocasia esculenta TaxID=4460 RepID=A0A843VNM9_COLES|nr:hypothetical protein [Colocasia esculenta]
MWESMDRRDLRRP